MELNEKTLNTLLYRRKRLEEKLHSLELRFSGMNLSFAPWVQDGAGRFSEERLEALIDRLVEAGNFYTENLRDSPWRRERTRLTPGREALLRSFLNCALRVSLSAPPMDWEEPFVYNLGRWGSWQTLLRLSEHLGGASRYDVFYFELYALSLYSSYGYTSPLSLQESLLPYFDMIYNHLSPEPISDTISREEQSYVQMLHQQEIAEMEAEEEAMRQALQIAVESGCPEDLEDPEDSALEDELLVEEYTKERACQEQLIQKWKAAFPNPEEFCRQYRLFRNCYFQDVDRHNLRDTVEQALTVFLAQEDGSAYLTDDLLFSAMLFLDKTHQQLSRLFPE